MIRGVSIVLPRPLQARNYTGSAILARVLELLTAHIDPVPPFDFGLTARHASWYAVGLGTERIEDDVWRRMTRAGGRPALVSVTSVGSVEEPRLEVRAEGEGLEGESLGALVSEVEWRLNTAYDLSGFYGMAAKDTGLSKTIDRFRGLKPGLDTDLFEALVGTILGQQLSTKVALTMQRRLIEKYGERVSINGEEYWLSPTPARFVEAGVEELKACKLSARKSEYIHNLAKAVALGELDLDLLWDMSNESVTETMVAYRGIGCVDGAANSLPLSRPERRAADVRPVPAKDDFQCIHGRPCRVARGCRGLYGPLGRVQGAGDDVYVRGTGGGG